MLNAIRKILSGTSDARVKILEVDEPNNVLYISENSAGVPIKVSLGCLYSFLSYLPKMSNSDIAKYAYYLWRYTDSRMFPLPNLSTKVEESGICLEGEGRGGKINCFDLASDQKIQLVANKVIREPRVLERFSQFAAFQIGQSCAAEMQRQLRQAC